MKTYPLAVGAILGLCSFAVSAPGRADQEPAPAAEITPGETQQSLQELNDKLTQARAVPHFVNGQPDGYRTYDAATGETHLQNGEVIHSIDGQKPVDPQHAFQIINTTALTNHRIDTITQDDESGGDAGGGSGD